MGLKVKGKEEQMFTPRFFFFEGNVYSTFNIEQWLRIYLRISLNKLVH